MSEVDYDGADPSFSAIDAYAPATANMENTRPVPAVLTLPAGTLNRNGYQEAIVGGETALYNDIPGKATPYTVTDENGVVVAAGSLMPDGRVRWIRCNTAPNVRDMGGWHCDGGKVRYGQIIRGGEPGADDADVLVRQCGIRHELSLRGAQEAPRDYSLLGVGFTTAEKYVWYTVNDASKEAWRTNLQCAFDCIRYGLPLYAHCSAGADRTGTFIAVLLAILGVSRGDTEQDYELSNFYTGTASDQQARRRNEPEWLGYMQGLFAVSLPNGAESNIKNHAIQFALDLGFGADEISGFRAAMIDGEPTQAVYSVAVSGNHAGISNGTKGILAGATYESTITAAQSYDISSVSVTMSGADITATAYNAETGEIHIENVSGDVAISVETTMRSYTNVWSIGALNARLNTAETNPAADGSVISGWIPLSQGDLSGDTLTLRSNMDLFNYAGNGGSGDYVRFYPTNAAGSQIVSVAMNDHRSWLTHENGVYTLMIPKSVYADKTAQITCMRFNAFLSTEPLTEDDFSECVLTVNEEI